MGVRKGWGENEEKESCVLSLFYSVIYAVFVYILWELTGTLVAYVVGKVMDNLGGNFIQFLYFHVIQ